MIVDLATFNIDTTQLFQKLTQTRAEIERLRLQQRELQREFANSNRSVSQNQQTLDRLNTELQGLTRGTASYNQTLAQRDQAERELNQSLLEQSRLNSNYQEQLTQNRLELNRLGNEARNYETVLNAQARATNENIDLYTRQRAELSLLQREQRELGVLMEEARRNNDTQRYNELSEAYTRASENASALATQLRNIDTAGGNFSSSIGTYTDSILEAYNAIERQKEALKQQQNQLAIASRELQQQNETLDRNSQEYRDNLRNINIYNTQINVLIADLRDLEEQQDRVVNGNNNLSEGFANAIQGFRNGNLREVADGVTQGFTNIGQSIKGMVTQSLAFIATPIGAAITALAGIGLAAKAVFDFNEGVKESNTLLKGLGVASGDISRVRSELEATAETYNKSFDEIAKTADSLATSYGISISQANDIIAKGLAQGGTANEDFLNQISEYDVQFKQLGFTAEESLAAINAGFAEGVYNDKLPDALKELGLSLTEGTKATRDALVNAFGQTFTDDLLKGVNTGAISVKDALQQIDKESQKVGLSLQQQQQLTADVFRGAGEDAGGALKIIEILNKAQVTGLTESQQAVENLREANERLNKVQAGLFEIENFGSVWANIKAEAINFFVDALEGFNDIKNEIKPLIDLVKNAFVTSWYVLKFAFKATMGEIKKGLVTLSNAITFVSQLPTRISNAFIGMKNTIISAVQSIVSIIKPLLSALGVDIDNITKKLNGLKGKTTEIKTKNAPKKGESLEEKGKKAIEKEEKVTNKQDKTTETKLKKENKAVSDAQKNKEDAQKALDDASKKEMDSAQKLAQEKIDLAKQELATYIEKNKSILENEKFLTKELADQEKQRLENIRKSRLEVLELENKTNKEKLDKEIKTLEEKGKLTAEEKNNLQTLILEKQQLENNYNAEKTKINEETNKQITATDTRYDTERIELEKARRAIRYETELLDLETKGATEYEIKQAQLDNQKQLELDKLVQTMDEKFQAKLDKDAEQLEIQTEIDTAIAVAEEELKIAKDENEIIRIQNFLNTAKNLRTKANEDEKKIEDAKEKTKLASYANSLGTIKGFFKENTAVAKAAGIAQATINTWLAASKTLTEPTLPFPANKIAAGVIVAQGLQQVAQISGVQGFADGGLVNGGIQISRSNGDNRLVTVKDGEVILNQRQQFALGGADVFKAIGVPGFATGGVVGGVSSLQSIQSQIIPQGIDTELLATAIGEQVMIGAMAGTEIGSNNGIGNYQDNSIIRASSNF